MTIRLYARFFVMNLKCQMQYKVSFFFTLLGQFLVSFTALLGVYFMFSRFSQIDGFTFEETLLCFASMLLSFSLAEMLGRGFDNFPRMLGNGEFDRALVRPRGAVFLVLAAKTDFTRLGRIFQALTVFAYAVPASGVVWTWGRIATLGLMIACGSFVFFGLFVVYASISFFTVEGLEFMNILTDGGREFGRYPFSVYGRMVLRFLTFVVPLALFQYYPLLYLLEKKSGAFYVLAPLISLLFLPVCYVLFRFGLRRYKSTGS